jgi:very-short-patch-repair endonuclease
MKKKPRSSKNIIIGQRVDPIKVERARQLRRRMTLEESILWEALRANRLDGFHFRRQQIIDGFIVDFYCHVAGLVVELDGGIHLQQRDYDEERDQVLSARSLRILRIPDEEVRQNLKSVLARIASACQAGNASPIV